MDAITIICMVVTFALGSGVGYDVGHMNGYNEAIDEMKMENQDE
jgi:hypothetical protein